MEINSSFWDQIKDNIKSRNKDNKFIQTWLDPISFVETTGYPDKTKMILGVPSALHQYFVMENLLDKIYSEVSENVKADFALDLVVTGASKSSELNSINDAFNKVEAPHIVEEFKAPTKTPIGILNQEYTFHTFVVGRNTEFAHAASYNVAQNPGAEGYNPLFICGPVGLGKTHLLHAVGNQIRNSFPQLRINYISAETFLNECVSAIRRQEMDKFRQKYREQSDILLVDDVQYIGRGEAVQEEFFHTINSFIERKKQVVVASDRMPKDILGLEDRSRSRLEWGLIADISMPDLETRVAIARYKTEKMGFGRLNEEVINYIARISKISVRELEGNIKKIKMYSELQGLKIDIDLAKKVLVNHETQTVISVEDIQKLVANHFKIKLNDLKSSTRSKQIVVPRQIAMFLIKKHLNKSLVDIGRAFGGKDHTTVINAIERVESLLIKDADFKNDIDELKTRIHNITGL